MLDRLGPHLLAWGEVHGAARNQAYRWNSFLVHDDLGHVRVLVDPLPLDRSEVEELEALGGPTHIVLTCAYHERCSAEFRSRWDCKLLVCDDQAEGIEVEFDGTFHEAEILWGFVEVVRVRNVRHREETCFYLRSDRTLIVGDLISGGRQDCGISDGHVGFNAPEYLVDLDLARISLRSLLRLDLDTMCFGHGTPLLADAGQVLESFIESQSSWETLHHQREEGLRLRPELRGLHST